MSLYLGENKIADNTCSRNVGEIVTSTIPLNDAGLHLLDGAVINGAGSYARFVIYIAGLVSNYPDLFCSEADWQQAVTDYGVCGKFVYDSQNNTVRLPKITGFVEGTTDLSALGDLVESGLPNITGTLNVGGPLSSAEKNLSGAFYQDTPNVTGEGGGSGSDYLARFDASRSSSIYGNSTTVQPQAIKVLYYIVIATSTKTNIEVNIDEIATDLNGKADVDLSNSTVPHITETYINGTSWYRVWSDGWIEQGGRCAAGSLVTVTLLKAFSNTNYNIQLQQYHNTSATPNTTRNLNVQLNTLTTESFKAYVNTDSSGAFWSTRGY